MNILFMCVANSARSQMAEGLAKLILGPHFNIESAGSKPWKINPWAIKVMSELGIDISNHHSKSIEEIDPKFVDRLNYIITLCAEEVCPTMAAQEAKRLHWPLSDPAGKSEGDNEQIKVFREVRDEIKKRIEQFKSEISRTSLQDLK